MKYDSNKKSAYLTGYQNISLTDELIKSSEGKKWKADWEESSEKKPYDYSSDLIRKGKMRTETDELFRYSLDIKNVYDDPTYLGFEIKFDSENSPLFNYSIFTPFDEPKVDEKKNSDVESFSEQTEKQKPTDDQKTEEEIKKEEEEKKKEEEKYVEFDNPSAISFIRKYSRIPEIKNREIIYFKFISTLDSIFKRTNTSNKFSKSYYIDSITGLDKMSSKIVKYDEDKITIRLTEDISLISSYLSELYNNLIYSYKNQHYLIPENCLRFDMMISITDMRIFKYLEKIDNDIVQKINNDPPRIIYTLHDCNFDFSNSIPFDAAITVGGRNEGAPSKFSTLSFDIKYKSISKNFRTSLIYDSLEIHNKLDILINSKILNRTEMFEHDIDSNKDITIQEEQDNFSNSEKLGTESENKPIINENEELKNKDHDERLKKMQSLPRLLTEKESIRYNDISYDPKYPVIYNNEGENRKDYSKLTLYNNEGDDDHVRGEDAVHEHDIVKNPEVTSYGIGDDLDGNGKGRKKLKKPSIKDRLGDFAKGFGNTLLNTTLDNVDAYKDKLISKFNDIRGELLQDMLRQIREPLNLPKIYPDNVYSTDFRTLSLESFARGLGSDLLNDVLDAANLSF